MTIDLDTDAIVCRYQADESVAAIARSLTVDPSAVRLRLERSGITIRCPRSATMANLRRDPGLASRMGAPRRWPVNEHFFDANTPDVAYVVGLLQADGHNSVERGIIRITLKLSDGPHLERVAEVMGCARPLLEQRDRIGHVTGLNLLVASRKLSAGLSTWGVVSPKTFTATTHPNLVDSSDYWRGMVDGDGSLCDTADGRQVLSLVGTRNICDEFLAFCQRRRAGMHRTVRPHKSIWSVHVQNGDAMTVASVLYGDAQLSLPRKLGTYRRWSS